MLKGLTPEQARQVRRAVVGLGDIDPKEQRRVVDEFFHIGPLQKQPRRGTSAREEPADKHLPTEGVELAGSLASMHSLPSPPPKQGYESAPRSGVPAQSHNTPSHNTQLPDTRPFLSLHDTEADKLVRVLDGERAQTIALVLSHLPQDQAGTVLARLDGTLQVEVIHCLIELEETDPEILQDVEKTLVTRLSQLVQMQRRRVAGMGAVAGILKATQGAVGMRILDNLAAHDRSLAETFTPRAIAFADLMRFDDASLAAVFRSADPELSLSALIGAPPELIDRVLQHFPIGEAEIVRHKLDHPGPIRLSDVEEARRRIAELARRLAMEGRIELPDQNTTTLLQDLVA